MIEALPMYVLTMIVLKKQVSQARRQNNKLRLQSAWAAIFGRRMS